MELKGKIAVVTGGSRGIGRAIIEAFITAGAKVAFSYRENKTEADKVTAWIEENGGTGRGFQADVCDRAAVSTMFTTVQQQWGAVDILVNNAGINKPTDFDQITDEDWDAVLGVNLKGPFVVTQTALPFLRDGGSVIHIGSVSGQYGGPRTAHYAASKAGLISLGQVIGRFLAPRGIRSNTLAAGLVQSEMAAAGLQSPAVQKALEGIPLGRMGSPAEIAQTVVFLGSDASRYITAQTINVNGGLYF
ncbi:SDR family NAD(P)-dependent oxidoreductase [Acanthopleuribacter pedis]|uniref:3-oxoacyl-ACP reductase FabG n=1 Tax=Acanthopleuribacter pedis TaxID=442870 RepID=A0A8J7U1Y5_9BACT|nr:3-oxoacyl-ACP reductase family protein [Acanthopleuribacter pedis]MBO1318032.1 3-oxoacyl-ACP reductase FabG [Acanthopleuribacter pedis]